MTSAIDLFAGPGGWDVAARELGIDVTGIELDPAACATRRAAGLHTIEGSVTEFSPEYPFPDGLIASPPCQSFSIAGHGHGRLAVDDLIRGIREMGDGRVPVFDPWVSEGARLVLEPLRWALRGDYEWIALEQVPTVLIVWERMAIVLREHGYNVATGIVSAEQYGVPQTRRRAVLLAHRSKAVRLPEPTHSRYHSRDPLRLDAGVKPWVSMAEALEWGLSGRPSYTIQAGGAATGGAEPFGPRTRRDLLTERDEGARWIQRSNYSAPETKTLKTAAERGRGERTMDQPSFVMTSKGFQWSSDAASVRPTIEECAILQTFPADYPWYGTKGKRHEQVGNAVPPLLAAALLSAVIER